MKSGKQRRLEIKEKRRKKAGSLNIDTTLEIQPLPKGAVQADHMELNHNNTYGLLPLFYIDKAFVCRDCGSKELWTAKQQKWWYEMAKGDINTTAIKCRKCGDRIKHEKDVQKQHMEKVAKIKPHPNEEFFKRKFT